MPGLDDLFGHNSVIKQLVLWGVLNQVLQASTSPALTALQQDLAHKHPLVALDAQTAADAHARGLMDEGQAANEASLTGIDAARWHILQALHKVRMSPADLAQLVLRDQISEGQADEQAAPQGVTPDMMRLYTYLAGDALGPEQLAEAARRDIIPKEGRGEGSTSFEQGIAESRLHNKWGPVLLALMHQLISVPDAASAVVRHFRDQADMEAVAAKWGIDAADFRTLIHLAGDAPGPQQLAEALRRGAIVRDGTGPESTSFEQGIAEGRLADKWAPVIEALARLWPTPVDAVNAEVKGQLTPAEGRELYERLGGDPQFYTWIRDAAGDAPSPLELADMAARGIIKWTGRGPDVLSFEQGVAEGRLKDKWTPAVRRFTEYLPPPSEIVTFAAHGAISDTRTRDLLSEHHMPADVLAAFVNEVDLTELSDYRGLTQAEVVDMYYAHLLTREQATAILEALHVTPRAAPLLLEYADLRQVIDSIKKSVERIATLYTGRKIGVETARAALNRLQIPSESVTRIIESWQLQAQANVKTLSETQISNAWKYKIIDQATAIQLLQAIGYSEFDAWALLSVNAKTPLPNRPPFEVAPPPGPVIPGTT